jgi:ERCC4-type nuclease
MPETRERIPERVSIITDHRESRTRTIQWLRSFDAEIVEKQLDVADYIVSESVGIERKTVADFLSSLLDQRLFSQMEKLTESFGRPLLIVEGEQQSLFTSRRMHPNSIHGALSTITLDYKVPIIWTSDPRLTAAQIYWTGYREQIKGRGRPSARVCKKMRGEKELQEFLVSGLPKINTKLSRRLLSEFGTVRNVFSATEEMLMEVDGIGKKKAREIWCALNGSYGKDGA